MTKIIYTSQLLRYYMYQLLISRRKKVGIKKLKNQKEFIDCLQTIDGVYRNLEDYN